MLLIRRLGNYIYSQWMSPLNHHIHSQGMSATIRSALTTESLRLSECDFCWSGLVWSISGDLGVKYVVVGVVELNQIKDG